MIKQIRLSVSAALSLLAIHFCFSSASVTCAQSNSSNIDHVSVVTKPEKPAISEPRTQPEKDAALISDPLVRVLITKGVLNEDEGRSLSVSGTPSEQSCQAITLFRGIATLSATRTFIVRAVAFVDDKNQELAVIPVEAQTAKVDDDIKP